MFAQNVSMVDAKQGNYRKMDGSTVLIQFADPDKRFPRVRGEFVETHQFHCWDVTKSDPAWEQLKDHAFSVQHAQHLAQVLMNAWTNQHNVLVHCVAGLCRSGAVVEVLVSAFKYQEVHKNRIPNYMVTSLTFEALDNAGFFDRPDCPAFQR